MLFGISALSERIAYHIDRHESVRPFNVKGFVIDDAYFNEADFAGKKVYRYSEARENFLQTTAMIVCIGYTKMNENRRKIFYRLQDDGWGIENFIHTQALINSNDFGTGNIFLCRTLVDFKSSMGDGNIFCSGHLSHHSRIGDFNFFSHNIMGGSIRVGDCCFFGLNSTVRNRVTIHDKTFVGAGCYLGRSTDKPGMCYAPPRAVCLGDSEQIMNRFTAH